MCSGGNAGPNSSWPDPTPRGNFVKLLHATGLRYIWTDLCVVESRDPVTYGVLYLRYPRTTKGPQVNTDPVGVAGVLLIKG